MTAENTKPDLIALTTDIVAAYVSNNPVPAGDRHHDHDGDELRISCWRFSLSGGFG